MKNIFLFFSLLCFSITQANPIAVGSDIVFLQVSTSTAWSIETNNVGWRCDSIKISSQTDTLLVAFADTSLNKIKNAATNYKLQLTRNNGVLQVFLNNSTLLHASTAVQLDINPEGDVVQLVSYSGGQSSFDKIIFGNANGAIFPALGGSRTYHKGVECEYYVFEWLSEDGKPNIEGIYLKGKVYDKNGKLLTNQTFYKRLNSNSYGGCGTFVADANGNYVDVIPYSTTINTIIVRPPNALPKYVKITPISVKGAWGDTIVADIQILEDITDLELPKSSSATHFVLYPNPTSTDAFLSYSIGTNAELVISTTNGTVVEKKLLLPNNTLQNIQLGSGYTQGIYLIKVLVDNCVVFSQELIVNK